MKNNVRKKISLYISLIFTLIITLAILLFLLGSEKNKTFGINECRVVTSQEKTKITDAFKNGILNDFIGNELKFTVVDLKGNIISANNSKDNKIDIVTEISFDNWYSGNNNDEIKYNTHLIVDGELKGIIIFEIPKDKLNEFLNDSWSRILLFLTIINVIGIIYTTKKLYKLIIEDLLQPIDEMHQSAKSILRGDLSKRVVYDYPGEIGEFAHDFEKTRDNLKEAREQEAKIKRSEKELIACISHDLKTPISTINGYCEGIIDGVVKDEENIKRYAGIILKKSKVLLKLIDDMLEFSKTEINEMTINKEEVYSSEYFNEIFEDISMDVVTSSRYFIVEGEIPNIIINIDKNRIFQVIYNLISNSIKYTQVNGEIKVSVQKEGEYLKVRVKDNGIGIGAGEISHVFEKFYRGEKHRGLDIPGSGLGLSIAKYIVNQHNGDISVKSERDKGTEVFFTLL